MRWVSLAIVALGSAAKYRAVCKFATVDSHMLTQIAEDVFGSIEPLRQVQAAATVEARLSETDGQGWGGSCEQWVTVARHCVVRLWLPRTWRLWALKEAEKQLGKELTVKVNCARSGTSSPRTTEACRSQSAKTAVSSVVE